MVGATGFEPATSATPLQRATKLRHAPKHSLMQPLEHGTHYTQLFLQKKPLKSKLATLLVGLSQQSSMLLAAWRGRAEIESYDSHYYRLQKA